jgi:hypothetical protein
VSKLAFIDLLWYYAAAAAASVVLRTFDCAASERDMIAACYEQLTAVVLRCCCCCRRTFDRAVTEEERDMIAACHEQLIAKMHTVQGMDDIDAKFKRVLDISVSCLSFEKWYFACEVSAAVVTGRRCRHTLTDARSTSAPVQHLKPIWTHAVSSSCLVCIWFIVLDHRVMLPLGARRWRSARLEQTAQPAWLPVTPELPF